MQRSLLSCSRVLARSTTTHARIAITVNRHILSYSTAPTSSSTNTPPKPSTKRSDRDAFSSSVGTGGLKRFWKNVTVDELPEGFVIKLDGRTLKTPDSKLVLIPKHRKALAYLVAAEWESQDRVLKAHALPLTSILTRAIDSLSDAEIKKGVLDQLLRYIHTDTICYHQAEPETIVQLQNENWVPIIQWLKQEYGIELKTTDGIMAFKQDASVIQALEKVIADLDLIELAAFEKAVMATKSFVIGLALLKRRLSVQEAETAARLEVLHQISRWGEVEDAHDVDREDLKRQLGSVAVVNL
ncbi:hypothetical protein SmJEL517_g05745 [Synchytrium microbalum]|uniref:ATP synthase mitochondrial F1 complex assembly factor 2 n=1 Tax=Synchytrium microbalum TaxID=1806994 RepID=A0A507BTY8_9FUNG|nr:uncharacterized protein SmJEL517_g05745 [Synchytrium microbalum]TPX30778.1 hypothetical protein SmJEL517_g05745 [Synchytrium microbalum]